MLKFLLFADDTTIIFSSADLQTLLEVVNKELEHLVDWFHENKLSLNLSKTNYMIFKGRRAASVDIDLLINGKPIQLVETVKFL